MMSDDDKQLLEKARPRLLDTIDLEGSDLIEHLRNRAVFRESQLQAIEVSLFFLLISAGLELCKKNLWPARPIEEEIH